MQDVVNFIKTVLSSTVIKIVWSYSVFILSFVSWRVCTVNQKHYPFSSLLSLHCFIIKTIFCWAVDICLLKTQICRNCYVRFEA